MRAGTAIRGAAGKEAADTGKSELLANVLPANALAGAAGARDGAFSGALLVASAAAPKQPAASPAPPRTGIAEPAMLTEEISPPAPAPLPTPDTPPTQPTMRAAYRPSASSAKAHGERQKLHADSGSIGAAPDAVQDASPPPAPSLALPASSAGAAVVAPAPASPAIPVPPATFAEPALIRSPTAANILQTETKTQAAASSDKPSLAMTTAAPAAPTGQPAVGAPAPTPASLATFAATPPVGGSAPPTPPAAQPAQSAAHAPPAPPHNPVAQLAPVLVAFATSASGTQHLIVRLSPPELGAVTIRVERPPEAPPRVEITVQHPQTLTLMLRDQPQLHHALDQAGIASDGRSLSFHLDDQGGGGSPGSGSAGDYRPAPTGRTAATATTIEDDPQPAVPIPLAWRRVGLDITA